MKHFKLIIILPLIFILQSCSLTGPEYIHFDKKETPNFYINEINSKLLNGENYSIEIFNTNLYKRIKIEDSEKVILENFINSLANSNYIDNEKPTTLEPYEMRIEFKDEKYIIKIYNETTITVFPWDGIYEEDLINMINVPERYNLLDFCTNIEKRININQ
jgi:hypothetical protein